MDAKAIKAELAKITLSVSAISQLLTDTPPVPPPVVPPIVPPVTPPTAGTIGSMIGNGTVPVLVRETPYVTMLAPYGFIQMRMFDVLKVLAQRFYPPKMVIVQASPEVGKIFTSNPAHKNPPATFCDIRYYDDPAKMKAFYQLFRQIFPKCIVYVNDATFSAMGLPWLQTSAPYHDDHTHLEPGPVINLEAVA